MSAPFSVKSGMFLEYGFKVSVPIQPAQSFVLRAGNWDWVYRGLKSKGESRQK